MGAAALRNTTAIFLERWPKPVPCHRLRSCRGKRPITSCCRKGSNKHRLGPVGLAIRSRRCERLCSGRVDLVFCGHLFMAPLAALITRLKGAKLIVQTHGIEAWPRPSRAQRAALEAADLVLCVSRHTRSAVLSWAAIAPERVLVVPDTVREAFTPGDGSTQRAALGARGEACSPDCRSDGLARALQGPRPRDRRDLRSRREGP